MKKKDKPFKHPLSVDFKEDNGYYTEYDEYERVTYHMDRYGFFNYMFYHDVCPNGPVNIKPYYVLHKYHTLYNPEFNYK